MIFKKFTIRTEKEYTNFCNFTEKTEVFKACGNPDDRWVITVHESEEKFNEWFTINQIELREMFK